MLEAGCSRRSSAKAITVSLSSPARRLENSRRTVRTLAVLTAAAGNTVSWTPSEDQWNQILDGSSSGSQIHWAVYGSLLTAEPDGTPYRTGWYSSGAGNIL